MCLMMYVVHMCACGACICIWCIYAHMCVWWCMYVYMAHIYAPVIGGAHVCMCCMYVYLCQHVFGGASGACMGTWCIYAHMCLVVHVCVYSAHVCMLCMYVYVVHQCTHMCLVVHVCVYYLPPGPSILFICKYFNYVQIKLVKCFWYDVSLWKGTR